MQDDLRSEQIAIDLSDSDPSEWLAEIEAMGEERGYFEPLGGRHSAILTDEGTTLVVTFETIDDIRATLPDQMPMGWELVRENGWSNLCLLAHEDSWFRDRTVFGYFDRLVEDGFFEEFERVVFYGAGMCGYAAAAFSVVAPDVTVIAVQPQATLDPTRTEWDRRFPKMRRTRFSDRYGFAPDMVEVADSVFVLYDPEITEDAMHAALFNGDNVHHIRSRWLGSDMARALWEMGVTRELVELAADGALTETACYTALRARRDHTTYLRRLLARVENTERMRLVQMLSKHVLSRRRIRRFKRSLAKAEQALEALQTP